MTVLAKDNTAIEMRKVYCETMIEMAAEDKRVMAVDADLVNPIGMMPFKKAYPDRLIDCGIMEGNMAGVAAGLSMAGFIPFTHTFSCFQSRKTIDQTFLTAGFAQANVKMVGSDPGLLALNNGASHMGLEDMGILQNVPNLTLVEPCDAVCLKAILPMIKDTYGLFYIRMNRKNAETIYDPATKFEIGKGNVLREGKDVTIICSGMMVGESLRAAEKLAAEGIEAKVVDMWTWQPIDEELIIASAKETGAIVTAENHRKVSGLGSAVAEVVVQECPVPMAILGPPTDHPIAGDRDYVMKHYGCDAQGIVKAASALLKRKLRSGHTGG